MDERPYLTPAELDFRRDESVTALGGGRYVVATDGATARGSEAATANRTGEPERRTDREHSDRMRTGRRRSNGTHTDRKHPDGTRTLDTDGGVETAEPRPDSATRRRPDGGPPGTSAPERGDYFVDLRVRTDEGTFETEVEGDDIGDVFAAMLRWYARRVSPDDDPENVLSILLSRSELGL